MVVGREMWPACGVTYLEDLEALAWYRAMCSAEWPATYIRCETLCGETCMVSSMIEATNQPTNIDTEFV